jgi:ABC-type bacteriocin/lantibiotic exporter with double-glycine peptidase domain
MFLRINKHAHIYKLITSQIKRNRYALVVIFIVVSIITALNIFLPFQYGNITEIFIKDGDIDKKLVLIISFVLLSKFILQFILSYITNYIARLIGLNSKQQIISEITANRPSLLEEYEIGDIYQRVLVELPTVQGKISIGIIYFIKDVVFILILLVLIYFLSSLVLINLFLFAVIYYFLSKVLLQKVKRNNKLIQENSAGIYNLLNEVIFGLNDIYIFRLSGFINRKLKHITVKLEKYYRNVAALSSMNNLLIEIIFVLFILITIYIITTSQLEVSEIVTLSSFLILLLWPIKEVNSFVYSITSVVPSYKRLDELLSNIRRLQVGKKENLNITGGNCLSVSLEKISFKHSKADDFVIRDLSYEFDEGVHLINGKNGVGKSTLINLLGGIRHQTTGEITVRLPLISTNTEYKNNCIKVVQQTPFLFDDSVWNNLQIVHPHLTYEELFKHIEYYGFSEIYNKISQYDSIGTNGNNLSGGEKQMISILRAVISDPPILLLDEISNHLSRAIKEHVLKSIVELRKKKITIIVSHQDIDYINFSSILNLDSETVNEEKKHVTV